LGVGRVLGWFEGVLGWDLNVLVKKTVLIG